MRIWRGHQEVSKDEAARWLERMASRPDNGLAQRLIEAEGLLALRDSDEVAALIEGLAREVLNASAVDPDRLSILAAPGWRGFLSRTWRRLLWRQVRFAHDWTTYQQNAVNHSLATLCLLLARRVRALEEERCTCPGQDRSDDGRESAACE